MSEAPTNSPLGVPPTPTPADPEPASPQSQSQVLYAPGGADTQSESDTQSGADTLGGDSSKKVEGEPAGDKIDLKLPDGFEATAETLASFTTLAQEAGLNNETAQRLLDLHVSELQKANESSSKLWETTISGWQAEISKDPDLGGEKTQAAQAVIAKALDAYGSAEARAAFDSTGAGWNPAIVRFVYKMAQALNEGAPVPGGAPRSTKARTPAAALYGETQS